MNGVGTLPFKFRQGEDKLVYSVLSSTIL